MPAHWWPSSSISPLWEKKDGDYKAFWGPIFTGDDAARLVALAAAMPPISRALSGAEETSPPAVPAIPLLRWFITRMVDYLIRLTISEDPSSRQGGDGRSAFASTHDAWLYALQASDSTVVGDEIGLAQLAEQVRAWHRPIEISAASPFRLCFRLEEPKTTNKPGKEEADPSEERWYVRYLLQPYDDPSLLIPLENVWKSKGRKASWLKRYNADVQAYMLSSLGQAAGLCPRISASLETATPSGYSLDTTAAHEFLTEKAILLEQSGFGVMLPAWWTARG